MTSRRRLLLILACLLVALPSGLLALSQTPAFRQRALAWAQTRLSQAMGREVRLDEVRFRPWTGALELSRLRVARGPSLADGVLFSTEMVRARWSWTGILRRHLVFREITLVRPRLTLPGDASQGLTVKHILPVLFQVQAGKAGGWVLRVQRAMVQDGHAAWSEVDGTQGTLEGLEGELGWNVSPDGVAITSGALRAARLQTTRGDTTRHLERIALQVSGTVDALSISAAEFSIAGASVTARGTIADPGQTRRLDLSLGVQAPLGSLLLLLGSSRQVEGRIALDGRLQGPWGQEVFRGEGSLQTERDRRGSEPLRFSVRWEAGRLEAETLGDRRPPDGSLHGKLSLLPATGAYQVQASLANTNLSALAGPLLAVASAFGVQLPPEVRGRLTADVDLAGRGTDLSTLRGHASLVADGLALEGETPTGRLEGRLSATASYVDIATFTLQLPGGDIEGSGRLRFDTGKVDLPIRADLRNVDAFGRGFGLPFLGGRATFQGRVVGTQAAPRLEGRLAWRDARVANHLIDHVEGVVEVGRRTLRTPLLTLRTGRTTATLGGSLEALGTTPLRQLNAKRDLSLDLQVRLNPARTADLVALLPDDLKITGTLRARGRLTGTLQTLSGDMEVAFEGVETWDESWQRGEALFRFRQGAVEIPQISLRRGAEQLTGEIGFGADGALRGRLTSTVMDIAKVGSLSSVPLAGRATFRLDLGGTLRDSITQGQVTASAISYRGLPLGPGTATFRIEGKAVHLDLTLQRGAYHLRLDVGPPSNRSVAGEITVSDGDLDLLLRAGEFQALGPIQPRGSGRILFRGPAGASEFENGEADLASLRLRFGGEVWENRGPVRGSWSGPTATIKQLRLASGGREFEIRGTLDERGQTDLAVTGQLPLRVLAGFTPAMHPTEGQATVDLHLRGSRSAPEAHGSLEIQRGGLRLSGVPAEFREVEATLSLQGERTEIQEWQAQLAGGKFRGEGEIHRRADQWGFRLTFQEEEGRAEQLLAGIYRGNGGVTGAMSLGGTLTSEGEEAADFWRNLDGDLKLVMRDGRFGHYTATAKILSVLSMSQLVELKGPELSAEGMPYRQVTADIKIERGTARTENFILDSPAMKMNAVGTADLAGETVDLTVAAKPFQNVDRIVTNIPVAGWLLGGKEHSLVVAYFRVTGAVSDPQVTPIPLRSVGRNLFGIFRNLLEIPETLTDAFEDNPPQAIKPEEGKKR